ncbi:hypothetical protein CJE1726 [Campylobacter jejuni RM1221]|nr:hypothetical protein CJE1726 [Campylobacter jejuni RM1221]
MRSSVFHHLQKVDPFFTSPKSFSKFSLAFCLNCMVLSFVIFKVYKKEHLKYSKKT